MIQSHVENHLNVAQIVTNYSEQQQKWMIGYLEINCSAFNPLIKTLVSVISLDGDGQVWPDQLSEDRSEDAGDWRASILGLNPYSSTLFRWFDFMNRLCMLAWISVLKQSCREEFSRYLAEFQRSLQTTEGKKKWTVFVGSTCWQPWRPPSPPLPPSPSPICLSSPWWCKLVCATAFFLPKCQHEFGVSSLYFCKTENE